MCLVDHLSGSSSAPVTYKCFIFWCVQERCRRLSYTWLLNSRPGCGPSLGGLTWNTELELGGALCCVHRAFWLLAVGFKRQAVGLLWVGWRIERGGWREMSKGKFRCDYWVCEVYQRQYTTRKSEPNAKGLDRQRRMWMWEGHEGGDTPYINTLM